MEVVTKHAVSQSTQMFNGDHRYDNLFYLGPPRQVGEEDEVTLDQCRLHQKEALINSKLRV
jgi:hypothetical protein